MFCVSVACDCPSSVLVVVLHWLVLWKEWVVMVTKRREVVRGSRGRSVRREYWQMQLRLTAGKNGSVSFAASRLMCGPVGVAGVASLSSRPVCKESTRRQSSRRIKGCIRDHPLRGVKKESLVIKKKKEEELKRLRTKVELLSKQQRWIKGPRGARRENEKRKWSGRGLQNGG